MENLCIKWDTQSSAFLQSISKIHLQERYSDATIICQGRYFSVHRIVLSSCSLYFEEMFENVNSQHPVIVFTDIEPSKMELLLNFMYQGEAEVEQENFLSFMKTGEALKIKGISVDDAFTCKNSLFDKKRKLTKTNTLRSKRILKSDREASSLALSSETVDEVNGILFSSGNDISTCNSTYKDDSDKKNIKEEPAFDRELSEALIENSETLMPYEVFDNSEITHYNADIKSEQKMVKNDEKFYFMDDIPEELTGANSEEYPSVSSKSAPLNNTQEKVGKKKISTQKGKKSSKMPVTAAEEMNDEFQYHIPTEGKSRRRCSSCAKKGKEKRTKIYCAACHLPFCNDCFTPWHLQLHFKSLWEL